MNKIKVGCAGWDYKDWRGPFYPRNMKEPQFLEFYASHFNIVEINSTFYSVPSEKRVKNWLIRVPEGFQFSVKAWQKITHDLNDPDLDLYVKQFFNQIRPLKEKIATILLQFPLWLNYTNKHVNQLKKVLNEIPSNYTNVIELRDNSWFDPHILSEFVDGAKIVLGTTYMPNVKPYYFLNQDKYYIRLIGDRQLTVFNRIQRKQESAIEDLKLNVNNLIQSPHVSDIFIITNNHFVGFAPDMANQIKKMLNLPHRSFDKQKKLIDFI